MNKKKNAECLPEIFEQFVNQTLSKLEKLALKKLAYTAKEAASVLSISECFVHELIRRGELAPVVRLGNRGVRIPVKTLEEFVERGGVEKGA